MQTGTVTGTGPVTGIKSMNWAAALPSGATALSKDILTNQRQRRLGCQPGVAPHKALPQVPGAHNMNSKGVPELRRHWNRPLHCALHCALHPACLPQLLLPGGAGVESFSFTRG